MLNKLRFWIISAITISGLLLATAPAMAHGRTSAYFSASAGSRLFAFGRRGFYRRDFGSLQASPAVMTGNALSQQAGAVVSEASPAVVYINAYKDMPAYALRYTRNGNRIFVSQTQTGTTSREVSSGSGFFIRSDGYILTNKHVVTDTTATYKVVVNGSALPAQVIYRDPTQDLAIIKIDGSNYLMLALGDSSQLTAGQDVVAIGNALGQLTNFATEGSITSLSQNITVSDDNGGSEALNGVLQTSARLFPGDSGGPLLNLNGQVIAVDTATQTSGRRVFAGYSILINIAKQVIANAGISL